MACSRPERSAPRARLSSLGLDHHAGARALAAVAACRADFFGTGFDNRQNRGYSRSHQTSGGAAAIAYLEEHAPTYLERLTVRNRNRVYRRFWQAGSGYDENVSDLRA